MIVPTLHEPYLVADPHRPFLGTARYYSRYRPTYPASLYDFLIEEVFPPRRANILDLGCGPGTIALPLAERGVSVLAVDPEVEMLMEGLRLDGERNQSRKSNPRIAWRLGRDTDVGDLAPFGLDGCIMGRSFHWMDRSRVLQHLDDVLANDAPIVVVSLFEPGDCAWAEVARDKVQELLGPFSPDAPAPTHEEIFAQSAFSATEHRTFEGDTLDLSVEDIIALELSCSYASPARLGALYEEFITSLHAELAKLAPEGVFRQPYVCDVLVARRPSN